jgi:hypothetical protein
MEDFKQTGEGSDHDSMKTLSSVTLKLSHEGFQAQFKALKNGLESLDTHTVYTPEQVKIVDFYRFEGESDPSDNVILYALETEKGEKGTLIDAYGTYQEVKVSDFIREVEEVHKQNAGEKHDDNGMEIQ